MTANILVSSLLLGVSAWMCWIQVKAYRELQVGRNELPDVSAKFLRGKFKRRTLTGILIGVVGVAILFTSRMLDPSTIRFWWFWLGLLGVVMLLFLSALVDSLANLRYLESVRRKQAASRQDWVNEVWNRDASEFAEDSLGASSCADERKF